MFLEKYSRFFRCYEFRFSSHARSVEPLPLVSHDETMPSLLKGLRKAQRTGYASLAQSNGDVIEVVQITHDAKLNAVILLIHRGSPDAPDPSYRKKTKDKLTLRPGKKDDDEEQAVSAHLIIRNKSIKPNVYQTILEEIPGISFSSVKELISKSLREYTFDYVEKKKTKSTYTCVKAYGIKSASLDDALKSDGALNFLTLTKTVVTGVPDADGIALAKDIKVTYRVTGNPADPGWLPKFEQFVTAARDDNWDDVRLDLNLDDKRHKTVKIDRLDEASEILFVRSEQLSFKTALEPCTLEIIPEVVTKALALIKD